MPAVTGGHSLEIRRGERFAFGRNWARFLSVLTPERIRAAEDGLTRLLGQDALKGCSFLDIGSGSGLSSLAARRLGAARVHSFDLDPQSVACTKELRSRYFQDDDAWTVEEGSALDAEYIRSLGQFDIVYSWGVLHHTGRMWDALANATLAVAPGGKLVVALYNDQGRRSLLWRRVKRIYNMLPDLVKPVFVVVIMGPREVLELLTSTFRLHPEIYLRRWTRYWTRRGMSHWHDMVDWIGGYPFEVARPEQVLDFMREKGFWITRMKTCGGGLGNNEFVLVRQ